MARVFRQTYTKPLPKDAEILLQKGKRCARFRDRSGNTVTARLSDDGTRILRESPKWYIEYKDADGVRRRTPGCRDRQATAKMAADLEARVEREKTGLIDRHARQRQRPLAEHLDNWKKYLLAKGNTEGHVAKSAQRARAVLDGCKCRFWPDVSASAVQIFLSDLRKPKGKHRGLAPQTVNDYLRSVKQFLKWMVADDRAPHNPLAHLKRYNEKTDIRRQRRALTAEECRSLIRAAAVGPDREGLAGLDRAMVYRIALGTGLRLSELRSLTPESFSLTARPPSVTLQAAYSKHRREDVQPLPAALARDLCQFLSGKEPGKRIFGEFQRAAEAIREDLEDAGVPYEDASGRVADFHALRHTFITNLAKAGVPPKMAMDLARHASIDLTMSHYSHTLVRDRAEALGALPDLVGIRESAAARATGTDAPAPPEGQHGNLGKQSDKP